MNILHEIITGDIENKRSKNQPNEKENLKARRKTRNEIWEKKRKQKHLNSSKNSF